MSYAFACRKVEEGQRRLRHGELIFSSHSFTNLLFKFTQTPPAIVALFIQFASFSFIAVALFFLWQVNQFQLTVLEIVLLQGTLALLMTRWAKLAWWWSVIQPLFPLAIALMLALTLPSFVYFLLFSFFLVFYWSTFRTQVPYFPSTKKVWRAVEEVLPKNRPIRFVDIGSGLGGLVLYLAKRYPESQFVGVEIAPLPWLVSYLRTVWRQGRATFFRSNYEEMDFAQFDVVFAYLSPAAMPKLWIKAKQEMRPGSMLISFEFPIEGVEPDLSIFPKNGQLNQINNGPALYLWKHC